MAPRDDLTLQYDNIIAGLGVAGSRCDLVPTTDVAFIDLLSLDCGLQPSTSTVGEP
jgi:hypothetical protein